jgi:tripartite ATP-independent transporter DctM subunit
MPFIIYGVVAQVSIADMFLAGILPGILMFALFCAVVALARPRRDAGATAVTGTDGERGRATLRALPVLTIPLAIVGGITGGFVTPTESAAVSVGIALLLGGLVYRELDATVLAGVLDRTVRTSASVLFLIVAAKAFGWILAFHNVPQQLAEWMRSLTDDATVFLFVTFVVLLLVGTVLDGIAALVVLVPVLLPIATGVYGIDPVHFGVVATVTLVIGLLTPPVGAGLYIAAAVAELDILRIGRALLPFLLAACGSVLLVILFPNLVDLR